MTTTKRCAICHCDLPLSEFRINKRESGHIWYHSWCKTCYNTHQRAWRKHMRRTDPAWAEKERMNAQRHRERNPEAHRAWQRAHYLKKKAEKMQRILESVREQS